MIALRHAHARSGEAASHGKPLGMASTNWRMHAPRGDLGVTDDVILAQEAAWPAASGRCRRRRGRGSHWEGAAARGVHAHGTWRGTCRKAEDIAITAAAAHTLCSKPL